MSANRVQFYESEGLVQAIVTQGESDLALIVELSGEGETWLSYSHFRLSPDQTQLTDLTDINSKLVRYRCPKSSP